MLDTAYALAGRTVLVTGAAGFIGYHLSEALLKSGARVVGLDNENAYYDPALKRARRERLERSGAFTFVRADIADRTAVEAVFSAHAPEIVVNLAAQAGVRHSIEHPRDYIESNILGFFNVLEACRNAKALSGIAVKHLVYASSSSVYGNTTQAPFSTDADASRPISLYAATKRSDELMAYAYSHLYALPATGLRFFTVYGPWGRPDMAYYRFAERIMSGAPIPVFNNGDMRRDFTYIDDAIACVLRVLACPPAGNDPHRLYNIGNNRPVRLMDFIAALESALGRTAVKEFLPMQDGDVHETCADISALERDLDIRPHTSIDEGLGRFAAWYLHYRESGCKGVRA